MSKSEKINFVEVGWFALHKSVASYSVSSRYFNQDEYAKHLSPVIELTGFEFESKFEPESSVSVKIWRAIQEIEKQNKDCNASRTVSLRILILLYNEWAGLRFGRKAKKIDFNDPLGAVEIGWQLVNQAMRPNASMDLMLWGLALLGWVAVVYIELRICKFCFRFAVPGSQFCFRHSQSSSLGISRSEAYSQYRKGREVNELIKSDGSFFPQADYAEEFGIIQARLVLADYLFFNLPTEEEVFLLRDVLQSTPRVMSRLGGNRILKLSDVELFTHIRKKINPLLLSNELWSMEVMMAEIYFSYEDRVPERTSGRPRKDGLRRKIIELAQSGLKPSEVAEKLKISKSGLSNWMSRYIDVRKAFQ